MKCSDVRHLIHLNAGHDLSAAEEHELRRIWKDVPSAVHIMKAWCRPCRR